MIPQYLPALLLLLATTAHAQLPLPEPSPTPLYDLLLPKYLQVGYATRAWVRDSLPTDRDPIELVDIIYARAVAEASGDLDLALVGALFAVFEHQDIPLSIGISLPLTLEPRELFEARIERLPRHLFADRPDADDRDKLQHFFASALIARLLDNAELADVVGIMIEEGEDAFVRGGVNDDRDVRANRLGHLFVELLREEPHLLPGVVLRAWNREYRRRTQP
jgi:hypothetical protein